MPDDEAAGAIEDTSDDPEVTAQKKDTDEALRQCLGQLSAEHREIVDLVYHHEKSVEEVAGIIGIPENTVKTRLFYAQETRRTAEGSGHRARLAMTTASRKIVEQGPGEIELLLPWHAAGTLNARDARKVEEALVRDPELARHYAVIREEYAGTIDLNESLGAPSARAMQKLFAAIDAPPPRALVRFAPDVRISDITGLLDIYQASIIDGTKGGMFRLQFANASMSKDEFANLLNRLQKEKIVGLAVATP